MSTIHIYDRQCNTLEESFFLDIYNHLPLQLTKRASAMIEVLLTSGRSSFFKEKNYEN